MTATKWLAAGTIALLTGVSFAQAQPAPAAGPGPARPGAPGMGAPGMAAPGTGGPGMAAPGMGGHAMGGPGMGGHAMGGHAIGGHAMGGHAMGGHAMGGGMHAGHMDAMPWHHIEGRIAFLKAELAIAEPQTAQWEAYAKAMRDGATAMKAAMEKHMASGPPQSAPDRADAAIAAMTARLETMKASAAAGRALYAVLTPAQKKTADELMMRRMGGR